MINVAAIRGQRAKLDNAHLNEPTNKMMASALFFVNAGNTCAGEKS